MTETVAVVRRATTDEVVALLVLIGAFYEIDGHEYDEARVTSALLPLVQDDTYGQVWVLDSSRDLAGYAVITWSYSLESGGRDCILDEIYVAHRTGGDGSRLLEAALVGARGAGARAVFLETEAHNERVRGFYGRHGFEIEDSVWMSRSLLD